MVGNILALNGSGVEDLSIGANGQSTPGTNGIVVNGNVNVNLANRIDNGNPLTVGNTLYITGATDIHGNVSTTGVETSTLASRCRRFHHHSRQPVDFRRGIAE